MSTKETDDREVCEGARRWSPSWRIWGRGWISGQCMSDGEGKGSAGSELPGGEDNGK